MKHFFILLLVFAGFIAKAQQADASADSNTVKINADSRLALVTNKPVTKAFIGKVRGFRVQIYNGNDRKIANDTKLSFMKSHPGVRSYIVYNNPQFRVRVGDFKTRGEAAQLQKTLSASFNPCMIVPDVINFATPRTKGKTMDNSNTTTN